jgi:hypothetical protein
LVGVVLGHQPKPEPQRQQSANISQNRTDIGALQSGHAHRITSPSSQIWPGDFC